jgi:hypothetical protein
MEKKVVTLAGLVRTMLLSIALDGIVCTVGASNQPGAIVPTPPSLEELASSMTRCEMRLLNLKVESKLIVQNWESDSDQWEDTPICFVCTAWYNGLPGSKVRFDIDKGVTQWDDGPAPFLEESYTVAFDGQYGRVTRHEGGALGEAERLGRGQITADAPGALKNVFLRRASGAAYSTFFFRDTEKMKLSDMFKQAASERTPVQITLEAFQSSDCIRVTGGDPEADHQSFWFDQARGFALVGYELINRRTDGTLVVLDRIRVTELAEAAPGIWYPLAAYHEYDASPESGERADRRCCYRASKVVANDPAFDESIFTPAFPAGYLIDDQVRGFTYRSGLHPRDLEKMLDDMAADVSSGRIEGLRSARAPTRSDGGASNGDGTLRQSAGEDTPRPLSSVQGRSRISPTLMVIIIAVPGAVLVAGLVLCRKRGRAQNLSVFLILLFALFGDQVGHLRAGDFGLPLPESHPDPSLVYHNNCGLNIGYVAARLFDVEVSLSQLVDEIGAGRLLERTISLLDLKRMFEAHSLSAEGFKADTDAEILEFLTPDNVIIVRLQRKSTARTLHHFSGIKAFRDGVLLIDPPRTPKMSARAALPQMCKPWQFTGEFLVVSKPPGRSAPGPAICLEADTVDLGRIPITTREISGEIVFRNVGTSLLRILRVNGSCSCFKGLLGGNEEVEPGQVGRIKVKFNKEKLSAGWHRQLVRIATNDSRNQVVRVYFTFLIQATPARKDIRLLPQNVDFGRAVCVDIRKKVVPLSIVIPEDPEHDLISVDVECSSSLLEVVRAETAEPDMTAAKVLDPNGMTVTTYMLTWREAPKPGCFAERIQFVVRQDGLDAKTVEVLVRGEAIDGI